MTTIFKYEPVSYLISLGRTEEAIKFLPLLYSTPTAKNEEEKIKIFEKFVEAEKIKLSSGSNQVVTLKQALVN